MKGIVLISHGCFVEGTYETSQWFMGKDIPQYTYIGLVEGEEMSSFNSSLHNSVDLWTESKKRSQKA